MINGSRLAGNQWPASGRDPIPLSDAFAVMLSVSSVISVATPTVHKSAQSGQPVDRPVPPVPISKIRRLRSELLSDIVDCLNQAVDSLPPFSNSIPANTSGINAEPLSL